MKHDKAWRAALKDERGIDAEKLAQTIGDALDNRCIPREAVEDAEVAVCDSYREFAAGNRTAALSHGQIAFERCNRLHTLLTLAPEVTARRNFQASQKQPRGSRRPLLDQWLREKLKLGRPTNDELWGAMPERGDLYRDDDEVTELSADGTPRKPLRREGFDKRVTAILKEMRR